MSTGKISTWYLILGFAVLILAPVLISAQEDQTFGPEPRPDPNPTGRLIRPRHDQKIAGVVGRGKTLEPVQVAPRIASGGDEEDIRMLFDCPKKLRPRLASPDLYRDNARVLGGKETNGISYFCIGKRCETDGNDADSPGRVIDHYARNH